jgi:hypothetical protein
LLLKQGGSAATSKIEIQLLLRRGAWRSNRHGSHAEKNGFSMQRHIHIHMISIYINIDGVEKMGYTTWKRQLKRNANNKQNLILTLTCGSLEIHTPLKGKTVSTKLSY